MSLRQSLRRSARAPGFALSVILLVAGVVAVNATLFSAIHALQWRALPYADGERIVHAGAMLQKLGFSIGLAERYRQQLAQDTALVAGAVGYRAIGTASDEAGREWQVTRTTGEWLDVLGAAPALGRNFAADDFIGEAATTIVLSDRTWRERFGADPGVLGRTLRLDDEVLTVIGVMPRGFAFPDGRSDGWKPLVHSAAERAQAGDANLGDLHVALRLAPGATAAQVRERLDALFAADERTADLRNTAGLQAQASTWRERFLTGHVRTLGLLQIAGLVLLVAVVANLVNLHLDRLLGRAREFRIRRALGAGDAHILRSVIADLAPPLLAGFALGLAAVPFGLATLVQRELLPASLLHPAEFGVVSVVAALVVTLLVLGCVALAVAGLRRAGGLSQRNAIGGLGRARAAMLVGQVMLTTVLLGGSGLLLRSAVNLMQSDPGFRAEGLVFTHVDFGTRGDVVPAATVEAVRAAVAGLPGIEHAAVADLAPFSGNEAMTKLEVPGVDTVQQARQRRVGIGYFDTMGIARLRGRDFVPADSSEGRAVVVDELYVERYLAGADPLAATLRLPDAEGRFGESASIVGVVRTIKTGALDETADLPTLYMVQRETYGGMFLLSRTAEDPAPLVEPIRERILAVAPGVEIGWNTPMLERFAELLAPRRAMIELVGAFAVATLLLACFGLASVLGVVVRRRESEFGVRMAIGATAGRIRVLVLRQGGLLIVAGIALGVAAGLPLADLLADRLFELSPRDTGTWSASAALVAVVALAACWLPANRAAAAQPVDALRSE